jgi:hypothetical protein
MFLMRSNRKKTVLFSAGTHRFDHRQTIYAYWQYCKKAHVLQCIVCFDVEAKPEHESTGKHDRKALERNMDVWLESVLDVLDFRLFNAAV